MKKKFSGLFFAPCSSHFAFAVEAAAGELTKASKNPSISVVPILTWK
jgi:hypothetical protein